jgi:hypothetical protein
VKIGVAWPTEPTNLQRLVVILVMGVKLPARGFSIAAFANVWLGDFTPSDGFVEGIAGDNSLGVTSL